MKKVLVLFVILFCIFCGILVLQSGLFCSSRSTRGCILLSSETSQKAKTSSVISAAEVIAPAVTVSLGADASPARRVTIGSSDVEGKFNFALELDSKGASVRKATFSKFDDRDYKNPQPLEILKPVELTGIGEIMSLSSKGVVFVDHKLLLPLDELHWKSLGIEKEFDSSSEKASFEAIIKDNDTNTAVLKITKTFRVKPDSYMIDCKVHIENLSVTNQKVRFNMSGPVGMDREAVRMDMRKIIGGFLGPEGQIKSEAIDAKKLKKAVTTDDRNLVKNGDGFLWAATVNKYFAAIVVPIPDEGKSFCDWMPSRQGYFYNPDGDTKASSGDETIGLNLKINPVILTSAGLADSTKEYDFQIFIGPKDKQLFDKNETYKRLGFMHTITFLGCCCPKAIINPLAFVVLGAMEWLHDFIPNYGVVIMILVLVVRLLMHPVTKKSQVSMGKMSKLAPQMEEIKKKYANNKVELNRHTMALYREHGASPVMSMIPMMLQMPIWIALYSAIYTSISLRGAAFLPVWITDLSAPDALFRFATVTIPIVGWKISSFNLLPIMMGVAMYFQQKMMPKQASAGTNPQIAQQQKMMMIMMPLMFPLLLYNAPSGLNLYIMTSTFAGVIEQHVIRKHIREKEQQESLGLVSATSKTGGKAKKKKPKPMFKTRG